MGHLLEVVCPAPAESLWLPKLASPLLLGEPYPTANSKQRSSYKSTSQLACMTTKNKATRTRHSTCAEDMSVIQHALLEMDTGKKTESFAAGRRPESVGFHKKDLVDVLHLLVTDDGSEIPRECCGKARAIVPQKRLKSDSSLHSKYLGIMQRRASERFAKLKSFRSDFSLPNSTQESAQLTRRQYQQPTSAALTPTIIQHNRIHAKSGTGRACTHDHGSNNGLRGIPEADQSSHEPQSISVAPSVPLE